MLDQCIDDNLKGYIITSLIAAGLSISSFILTKDSYLRKKVYPIFAIEIYLTLLVVITIVIIISCYAASKITIDDRSGKDIIFAPYIIYLIMLVAWSFIYFTSAKDTSLAQVFSVFFLISSIWLVWNLGFIYPQLIPLYILIILWNIYIVAMSVSLPR